MTARRFKLAMVLEAEAAHRVAFEDLQRMLAAQLSPGRVFQDAMLTGADAAQRRALEVFRRSFYVDDPCDDWTIEGRDLTAFLRLNGLSGLHADAK